MKESDFVADYVDMMIPNLYCKSSILEAKSLPLNKYTL